jgi:hypothetical protein
MALLLTGTASAQSGSQPEPYRALLECRSRTDDAARLRCLDAALAAMETARGRGDVLVSSRAETVAARRSLFGFTVPQFLRGDGQNDEREEIKELKTTVRSARDTGFMKYSLDLAEGGSWQTTDPHKGAPPPRTGTSVTIRRSALGSYFVHIPGQSPLRARRTN